MRSSAGCRYSAGFSIYSAHTDTTVRMSVVSLSFFSVFYPIKTVFVDPRLFTGTGTCTHSYTCAHAQSQTHDMHTFFFFVELHLLCLAVSFLFSSFLFFSLFSCFFKPPPPPPYSLSAANTPSPLPSLLSFSPLPSSLLFALYLAPLPMMLAPPHPPHCGSSSASPSTPLSPPSLGVFLFCLSVCLCVCLSVCQSVCLCLNVFT